MSIFERELGAFFPELQLTAVAVPRPLLLAFLCSPLPGAGNPVRFSLVEDGCRSPAVGEGRSDGVTAAAKGLRGQRQRRCGSWGVRWLKSFSSGWCGGAVED